MYTRIYFFQTRLCWKLLDFCGTQKNYYSNYFLNMAIYYLILFSLYSENAVRIFSILNLTWFSPKSYLTPQTFASLQSRALYSILYHVLGYIVHAPPLLLTFISHNFRPYPARKASIARVAHTIYARRHFSAISFDLARQYVVGSTVTLYTCMNPKSTCQFIERPG